MGKSLRRFVCWLVGHRPWIVVEGWWCGRCGAPLTLDDVHPAQAERIMGPRR